LAAAVATVVAPTAAATAVTGVSVTVVVAASVVAVAVAAVTFDDTVTLVFTYFNSNTLEKENYYFKTTAEAAASKVKGLNPDNTV
jgi:hypothetical protein